MSFSYVEGLSSFVFNFAVPCMLFRAMATLEPMAAVPWRLLVAYYVGAFGVFACGLGSGGARSSNP